VPVKLASYNTKFHIIAMFVTSDIQTITHTHFLEVFTSYRRTKFHLMAAFGPLLIAIIP
jgi:hypothetical protein